jgi:hypothetical protein
MPFIGNQPTSVPLTSSDITDGIISLPKLTDGTDGNLISYDASGNPVAVATGTDGQVLTSTGAGSPPAFEDASGGANTPAFQAVMSSTQSFSNNTYTKASLATEVFDTNSNYDTSNYRFTPQVAGKYYTHFQWGSGGGSPQALFASIYKNGSLFSEGKLYMTGGDPFDDFIPQTSKIIEMNGSSDYVEFYVKQVDGTQSIGSDTYITFAEAYKIIE